jgi:hypothetical protein
MRSRTGMRRPTGIAFAEQVPGIDIPRSPLCLFEMIDSKPMQLDALLGTDFCDCGL